MSQQPLITKFALILLAALLSFCCCRKNDAVVMDLERRVALLERQIAESEGAAPEVRELPTSDHGHQANMATEMDEPETAASLKEVASEPSDESESVEPLDDAGSAEPLEVMDTEKVRDQPVETVDVDAPVDPVPSSVASNEEPTGQASQGIVMPAAQVTEAYKKALEDYHANRYEQASAVFQAIAEAHPTHALAPNALYWLGETEYDQDRYNQAILIFQRVMDTYPDAYKASAALLKKGKAQEKLGQYDAALESYRQVIARYPKSDAANLARQWQ